ncbi:MAG: cation-translocating P-type ATPase [Proteobacteria bacterium]|nr:cation-translocating P-type ATPase [Pseudomonadota bacterium]
MSIDFTSTIYKGLSENEALERRNTEGYNELPSSKRKNIFSMALGVIKEPMFILLVSAGTLYLILGDVGEGVILLCFVFLIMGIEFHQEKKTESALDALRDLASPRAMVIRDGVAKLIPSRDMVTRDIFILKEGDRVPADARVLQGLNLLADESLLTGESVPVRKRAWTGDEHPFSPGGDDLPYVYSSSMIVQGNAILEATATGIHTEIGKIGKAIETIPEEPSRLKKEMRGLITRIALIGIALCVLLVIVYALTRDNLLNGILAGITLAMSILPEEFPVILTVFLAIGAFRMSRKQVLARKSSTLETLGSTTVLCTDKTGTLTCNTMTVNLLYNGRHIHDVMNCRTCPAAFHDILEYGILASQINPFDPMEKAIIQMGSLYLTTPRHNHTHYKVVKEYPLSQNLLAMSRVFVHEKTGEHIIAAKGAPEAIFDLCHLPDHEKLLFSQTTEAFAEQGLRVLGVAMSENNLSPLPENQHDIEFNFVGLVGMKDPIREQVPQAVAECYMAGVRVIMVTGDYPVTARNIGQEIGLKNPEHVISGQELKVMSEEELSQRIKEVNIFARVLPEQKLNIVHALRKNNEIVAMTGDGVNDAPALKASDIGISMGKKGTDVARESSHLVIMDDNFSSIVSGMKMGRRIFDNLQKALAYTFAIHVPITGLALIPVFFKDLPLMLWPVHVVFLEMIIDPACSIIFEAEQEEKNVMKRPPKPLDEPFFGIEKIMMSCTQGLFILASVFLVYGFGVYLGFPEREIRSLTFTCLIAANIATILSNRSWTRHIFQILFIPNPTVTWVLGGAIFFLILVLNVPLFLDLFKFQPISLFKAALASLTGLLSITWFECYKFLKLKH